MKLFVGAVNLVLFRICFSRAFYRIFALWMVDIVSGVKAFPRNVKSPAIHVTQISS
jgi:hypothetical protein